MAYEYKAVAFMASVKGTDKKSADNTAAQLTAAVNAEAVDGWDLYQIQAVTVMVAPGCLAALGGTKAQPAWLDQLIFRRQRD